MVHNKERNNTTGSNRGFDPQGTYAFITPIAHRNRNYGPGETIRLISSEHLGRFPQEITADAWLAEDVVGYRDGRSCPKR